MSSCFVQFDNFQGQYFPGNNIVGRVICSFTQTKDIREIRLKLRGKEQTSWPGSENFYDTERKGTRTRTVEFTGENLFLSLDTSLRGAGKIGPGRFEYPFSYILPVNIPSTFNGKYGSVKYSIKAIIDRPFKADYRDNKEFIVVAPIDFNELKDRLHLNHVVYSDQKSLCCFCCVSGPITMNVHLDKEAFVHGEQAHVRVEISNMSNENIDRLEVKLGMTTQSSVLNPRSESKYEYELIAARNETGVGAHGERTYKLKLDIPQSLVIPNFSFCTLFKHWTELKVKAILPSCHENMDVTTKIVMGHIPIRTPQQDQSTPEDGSHPPQKYDQYPPGDAPHSSVDSIYLPSDICRPPYPLEHNSTQYPSAGQTPYSTSFESLALNSQPSPYPPNANLAPYPPVAPSPCSGSIGFVVPQPATSYPPKFPSLSSDAHPHAPMPQPGSAPYPTEMEPGNKLEAGGDFVMVDASAIG